MYCLTWHPFFRNFTDCVRTWEACRKKYQNLVASAKKKSDALKHPKTGGGRRPPDPTPAEEVILEEMSGRPVLEGLGGIDTASCSSYDATEPPRAESQTFPIKIDDEGVMYVEMNAPSTLPESVKTATVLNKCMQLSQESQEIEGATLPLTSIPEEKQSVQKKKKINTKDLNGIWKTYLEAATRSATAQEHYYQVKTKILRKKTQHCRLKLL